MCHHAQLIFWDGILLTFCPGWPQPVIHLISASWVAGIIGMSHHGLPDFSSFLPAFYVVSGFFFSHFDTVLIPHHGFGLHFLKDSNIEHLLCACCYLLAFLLKCLLMCSTHFLIKLRFLCYSVSLYMLFRVLYIFQILIGLLSNM
jgi:hypothetical protein